MAALELEFFLNSDHLALKRNLATFVERFIEPRAGEEADEEKQGIDFIRLMADEGLLKYVVPRDHGGLHSVLDIRSLCLIREGLAYSSSLADTMFAMQGLGSCPITLAGSEEVKARFLPEVASGRAIAAFAVTEPEAGSDVASLQSTAHLVGDRYILNGVKTLISNAGIADIYTVFAKTDPEKGHRGISAFVITKDQPGLVLKKKLAMMAPHPIGEIEFRDCEVPRNWLLGREGNGFTIAMATLDNFRPTVGAAALGLAGRALAEAVAYARRRVQFGHPLAEFQGIKFMLAEMATELDAAGLLVYRAAWKKDKGAGRVTRESSMAKYYATEAGQRIVDQALQIHGGIGVVRGTVVERLYREIRALRLYEGTTEIQKLVIAKELFGSGG